MTPAARAVVAYRAALARHRHVILAGHGPDAEIWADRERRRYRDALCDVIPPGPTREELLVALLAENDHLSWGIARTRRAVEFRLGVRRLTSRDPLKRAVVAAVRAASTVTTVTAKEAS